MKQSYKSLQYGLCYFSLTSQGVFNIYEIVIRTVTKMQKVFQRQYTLEDFQIVSNWKSNQEIKEEVVEKVSEILINASGDIFLDFFDLKISPILSSRKPSIFTEVDHQTLQHFKQDDNTFGKQSMTQSLHFLKLDESKISEIKPLIRESYSPLNLPMTKIEKIVSIQSQIRRLLAMKQFKAKKDSTINVLHKFIFRGLNENGEPKYIEIKIQMLSDQQVILKGKDMSKKEKDQFETMVLLQNYNEIDNHEMFFNQIRSRISIKLVSGDQSGQKVYKFELQQQTNDDQQHAYNDLTNSQVDGRSFNLMQQQSSNKKKEVSNKVNKKNYKLTAGKLKDISIGSESHKKGNRVRGEMISTTPQVCDLMNMSNFSSLNRTQTMVRGFGSTLMTPKGGIIKLGEELSCFLENSSQKSGLQNNTSAIKRNQQSKQKKSKQVIKKKNLRIPTKTNQIEGGEQNEEDPEMEKAAFIIQKRYRIQKQKQKQKEDQEMAEQVIKIQAAFRGRKVRQNNKATILQATATQQQVDKEMEAQAIKIQSVFRSRKARKDIIKDKKQEDNLKSYKESEDQIVKIQAVFRGRKAREQVKKVEQEQRELKASALKIQAVFRGKQTRKGLQKEKVQDNGQEQNQNMISQEQKDKEALELQASALKIQAVFRGKQTRKTLTQKSQKGDEKVKELEQQAIKIQSVFRGHQSRKQVAQIKIEKDEMAKQVVKIQAAFRGKKARFNVTTLKKNTIQTTDEQEDERLRKHLKSKFDQSAPFSENFYKSFYESISISEKEPLFSFNIKNETLSVNEQIQVLINPKSLLLILKSDKAATMSSYLHDIVMKYRKNQTQIQSWDECLDFLKQILPQVTTILDSKFKLIDVVQDRTQLEFKQHNNNDSANQEQYFDTVILHEINFIDLKFRKGLLPLRILINSDKQGNIFVKLNNDPQNVKISKETVQSISSIKGNNNDTETALNLKKELLIRIGLLNSSLEEQEYMTIDSIKNIISIFTQENSEVSSNVQKISEIEKSALMIQKAFRSKNQNKQSRDIKPSLKDEEVKSKEAEGRLLTLSNRNSDKAKGLSHIREEEIQSQEQSLQSSQLRPIINKYSLNSTQSKHSHIQSLKSVLNSQHKTMMTLLKDKIVVSGEQCIVEVKLNFEQDSIQLRAYSFDSQRQSIFTIDEAKLTGKSLKSTTQEVKEVLEKLEFDEEGNLQIRSSFDEYSFLSNDIVFKKGIDIQGTFYIVTAANENSHLVFEAYDEKTEKRLELRIKKQFKAMSLCDDELVEMVKKLDVMKLGQQDILIIKQ